MAELEAINDEKTKLIKQTNDELSKKNEESFDWHRSPGRTDKFAESGAKCPQPLSSKHQGCC